MTAVAASKVGPTFRQRMAEGYVKAAIFALEKLAEANKSVVHFQHGEFEWNIERYRNALARAEFWRLEAANCEGMVLLLEAMDGQ